MKYWSSGLQEWIKVNFRLFLNPLFHRSIYPGLFFLSSLFIFSFLGAKANPKRPHYK
jgi:hypothetical protein